MVLSSKTQTVNDLFTCFHVIQLSAALHLIAHALNDQTNPEEMGEVWPGKQSAGLLALKSFMQFIKSHFSVRESMSLRSSCKFAYIYILKGSFSRTEKIQLTSRN